VESTDKWLRLGNPLGAERPEDAFEVKMGGAHGKAYHATGRGARYVDSAEAGARSSARYARFLATGPHGQHHAPVGCAGRGELRLETFNHGDFLGAVAYKVSSENISKILYPNDEGIQGKQLPAGAQFFFVSCSLQHILKIQATQTVRWLLHRTRQSIRMTTRTRPIAVAELDAGC